MNFIKMCRCGVQLEFSKQDIKKKINYKYGEKHKRYGVIYSKCNSKIVRCPICNYEISLECVVSSKNYKYDDGLFEEVKD